MINTDKIFKLQLWNAITSTITISSIEYRKADACKSRTSMERSSFSVMRSGTRRQPWLAPALCREIEALKGCLQTLLTQKHSFDAFYAFFNVDRN